MAKNRSRYRRRKHQSLVINHFIKYEYIIYIYTSDTSACFRINKYDVNQLSYEKSSLFVECFLQPYVSIFSLAKDKKSCFIACMHSLKYVYHSAHNFIRLLHVERTENCIYFLLFRLNQRVASTPNAF